jgi:LPS-assembly protein
VLIALAICLLLAAFPAAAQEPVRLEADHVTFDRAADTYTATGNVTLTRGETWLHSDTAIFRRAASEVEATGDIHGLLDSTEFWGSRATLNLERRTARLEEARVFIPESNYYIRAEVLEKVAPDRFTAKEARITTCAGDKPAWSFLSSRINLALEGYATIYHTTFRIKDVPVLYTPFFILPAKRKRQTGFLTPQPGSSALDGFTLDIPFFWAISDNTDATFYAGLKTSRGVMEGLEYRYVLGEHSYGTIQGSYLRDSRTDEAFLEVDKIPRTNKNRWWVRGKADQELPLNFALRADLDAVSDEDYLREFVSGYQGFRDSNAYFIKSFDRSLQEESDLVRESSLVAFRGQGVHYLSGEVRYFEDLLASREEFTLQRLPTLRYEATEHPLLGPLYWQLATRYDYFWRQAEPELAPRGQRLDLEPRLRLPLNLGRYVSVIPTASFRETLYLSEGRQDGSDVEGFRNRQDYSVGGTISTQLSRVFGTGSARLPALKHILQPELSYVFQPRVGQADLPRFDPRDRPEELNVLDLSLTNDLIGKIAAGKGFSYLRLARLRLAQGLDFNRLNDEPARPLLPLFAETEFNYARFVVDADAQWDWHQTNFARYGILAAWSHPAGHALSLDYQFLRDLADEINFAGTLRVLSDLALYTVQRSSLQADRLIESSFGIRYQAQCWAADLSYRRSPFDQQVVLRITLGGIGELGAFGFEAARAGG